MEKSEFKQLKEQLLTRRKNGYDRMSDADRAAMGAYCADYKAFLGAGKAQGIPIPTAERDSRTNFIR